MTTAGFAARLPGAAWARQAGAHLRWRLRRSRADAADRAERPFRYVHPLVGPFAYHPRDYLSRRLFLYDDFERSELRFAVDRAREGGIILDVGANIGAFTVACARAAGPRGHVIAVEPGPATFRKLTDSCAVAGVTNVTLIHAAAGPARGTGQLVLPPSGRDVHQRLAAPHEPTGPVVPVGITTLDDVCGGRVTLVKLDVEGHELAVLQGASRILMSGTASLIVEFNPIALAAAAASPSALWEMLRRTHRCIAAYGEDGSARAAAEQVGGDEVVNTIWEPHRR